MAKRIGGSMRDYVEQLPATFMEKVLPRAARAGAEVIADEARRQLGNQMARTKNGKVRIADAVRVTVTIDGDKIRARVELKGPGAYVGRWLEYGTAPHIIRVRFSETGGVSARRLNLRERRAAQEQNRSLFINGKPVGAVVFHKGARPKRFLRPAFDLRRDEALQVAQTYIYSRVVRGQRLASAGGRR